jgi:hypothetical protein
VKRIFLDEQAERDFARDGYAVVRLISAEEAASLLDGLAPLRVPHGPTRNEQSSGIYVSFMDSDLDQRRRIYHYFRDALASRIERILDDYTVLAATLLDKPAGEGDMDLHRDWWMSADMNDRNVIVWCPLVDTDNSNGTIRLVVGSHRLIPDLSAAHGEVYFAHYQAELKEKARSFPMRAGEALIFDATTLHWSPANGSDRDRPAVNLMCLPRSALPVFYKKQPSSEGSMFEMFDMRDDGYYEHDMADFLAGTIRRNSLGLVPNPNRPMTLEECERRLAEANARSVGGGGGHKALGWGKRISMLLARALSARTRHG